MSLVHRLRNALREVYSRDTRFLYHYLRGDFDVYALDPRVFVEFVWNEVDPEEYGAEDGDVLLQNWLQTEDYYELADKGGFWDRYYEHVPEEVRDAFENAVSSGQYEEALYDGFGNFTHTAFDRRNAKHLKRLTWLVHFSDEAHRIAANGFRFGTDDVSWLGLTKFHSKKFPGYNFAFEALSREADEAARTKKYGRDCVMFQNSGVRAYHWGDGEDQVIFYGPDVKPERIILIEHNPYGGELYQNYLDKSNSYDYSRLNDPAYEREPVSVPLDRWEVYGRNYRVLASLETYEDAAQWVIQNEHQYRRLLYWKRPPAPYPV